MMADPIGKSRKRIVGRASLPFGNLIDGRDARPYVELHIRMVMWS